MFGLRPKFIRSVLHQRSGMLLFDRKQLWSGVFGETDFRVLFFQIVREEQEVLCLGRNDTSVYPFEQFGVA